MTAKLIRVQGENVTLLKDDGTEVTVPTNRFCRSDQRYIESQADTTLKTDEASAQGPNKSDGGGAPFEVEQKCQQLCEQLTKAYKGATVPAKPTIAVVEFSDLAGGVTDLGRLLSEELITKLFSTGKYKVIERLLLNKAIAEHKLQLQGIVDPKSAKELGKILGVDAIVSGTIADMGEFLRVNGRLISTETGEVFSVAAVTIRKDAVVTMTGSRGTAAGPNSAGESDEGSGTQAKIQLPYRQDFSKYQDDNSNTDWGRNGKVKTKSDGRKWLIPSRNGQKPVGIDVDLPEQTYIEFDYIAEPTVRAVGRGRVESILSGISLVDEAGAKYRIEWNIALIHGYFAGNGTHHVLSFPGAERAPEMPSGAPARDTETTGAVSIRKEGDTITVRVANRKVTGSTSDFKKFVRFEVDLYKGPNATVSFTNFKIGKLK